MTRKVGSSSKPLIQELPSDADPLGAEIQPKPPDDSEHVLVVSDDVALQGSMKAFETAVRALSVVADVF